MSHYRLFLYNHENHIVDSLSIEADNDLAAFTEAFAQLNCYDIELWQGARFVIRIPRHATAQTRSG